MLRGYVAALGRQIAHGGLLGRERYSSDIPNGVYGLHSQAVAWAGLRAIADAWGTGADALHERARLPRSSNAPSGAPCARRSGGCPTARSSSRCSCSTDERPYASLTQERLGSYWNLVMPYALASGLFPPGSREAKGALRYMLLHGSRLLGLVRAGGYALYGRDVRPPVSGHRPGLRQQRRALPRRQRPGRPARAQPVRHARRVDDAADVRLRRGGERRAARRCRLPRDVPTAERREQRRVPRDAEADARARDAGRVAARVRDTARVARRGQADRRRERADELRSRSRTRWPRPRAR